LYLPLLKAISLWAEAGINYKTEDFAARVSELTEGRGANIILDCVGGSYAAQDMEALAVDGRYNPLKYTVAKICETYIMLMVGITD
jgi:NADPH:quinone reductase-like Zn-dependent oxidoreductase